MSWPLFSCPHTVFREVGFRSSSHCRLTTLCVYHFWTPPMNYNVFLNNHSSKDLHLKKTEECIGWDTMSTAQKLRKRIVWKVHIIRSAIDKCYNSIFFLIADNFTPYRRTIKSKLENNNGIPPFRKSLKQAVLSQHQLLTIIGNNWLADNSISITLIDEYLID